MEFLIVGKNSITVIPNFFHELIHWAPLFSLPLVNLMVFGRQRTLGVLLDVSNAIELKIDSSELVAKEEGVEAIDEFLFGYFL